MGVRKHIPIAEFQALGYLQELNRRFLHPLGLALEVNVAEDGTMSLARYLGLTGRRRRDHLRRERDG